MSSLTNFLQKFMAWVLPRPRLILGVALLTVIASIWITVSRLEVQTDQLELISERHPLIALSDRLDSFNFHGKATFTVVVRAPSQERAIEFMNALAGRIHGDPVHFQDILYRIDPKEFKKWVLYYLDKDELVQIEKRIEDHADLIQKMAENPDLLNFFKLVNQEMASRMVGEFFTGFLDDDSPQNSSKDSEPMDLDFLIKVTDGLSRHLTGNPKYVSPWASFFKSGAWDLEKEGYLWEGGKKLLIASVMPVKIRDGVSKTQTSLAKLREYIGEMRASSFRDVEAGVTGQEALNNDEMITAMTDMTTATWLSLLAVMVLMALFLRSVRHPLIITVSLAVGLIWTFGWTSIFIGHLNILSIVFAPMLCGLGVDYAIHWFARFEEESGLTSRGRLEIIKNVMDRSGPGIMLAGLSTAFSFLPFILTGFRGLMELGMITGMGILFTVLADFTVLPALSCYFASEKPGKDRDDPGKNRFLFRLGPRAVRTILASSLALCVLGGYGALHVKFDLNPLRLQSRDSESVFWEKVLVESSDRSVISAAVLTNSPEETKAESARFKALSTVADVDTVFTLLPENQEEKVPVLRSIMAAVPDLDRSVPRFAEGPAYVSLSPAVDPNALTRYETELIGVLERIRFKMQDEQASKWGASRPIIEQMVQVRELAANIIDLLKSSPDMSARLGEYRLRFKNDIVDKWSLLRESSSASPMRIEDIPSQLKDQFLQGNEYLVRIYPKESIWDEGALGRFVTDVRKVNPDVVGDPISLFVFSSAFKRASIAASIYAVIAISLLLTITFRSVRFMVDLIGPADRRDDLDSGNYGCGRL